MGISINTGIFIMPLFLSARTFESSIKAFKQYVELLLISKKPYSGIYFKPLCSDQSHNAFTYVNIRSNKGMSFQLILNLVMYESLFISHVHL